MRRSHSYLLLRLIHHILRHMLLRPKLPHGVVPEPGLGTKIFKPLQEDEEDWKEEMQ